MATGSKPGLPNEFYTASTFFTLSGIAGAVWLFCLVLSNFESVNAHLDAEMYRVIALALSLILAIMMLLRQKIKKKMEHWLFAFFNALLIFINASGLNAIQNNLSFVDEMTVSRTNDSGKAEKDSIQKASAFPLAMMPFFKNNVSWWPDKTLVMENKKLKVEYAMLKQEIDQIKNKIANTENDSEIISQNNAQLADSINKQFATLEGITDAYSNLNKKFGNASESLAVCQGELEVLTSKINDITTLYEAEKDKNIELNEQYSIQTDTLDKALEELAKCQSKLKGLSREVKEILALYNSEKGKNKKRTIEIDALKKSISDKTREFDKLKVLYKKLIINYKQMKKDLDECNKKLPKSKIIN